MLLIELIAVVMVASIVMLMDGFAAEAVRQLAGDG